MPLELELVTRQVFSFLNPLDEFILFNAPFAFYSSFRQDLLQLLDSQLAQILLFQIFRFNGEFDSADFRVGLCNSLAHFERRHAQGERLGNIALDRVDVITDFLFSCRQRIILVGAVLSHGVFDFWLFLGVFFCHCGANVVHDLDADCSRMCNVLYKKCTKV
jgi:hypothetical protein